MSAPGHIQRSADGGRDDWQTPPALFWLLDKEFDFDIDGAADAGNALCPRFYAVADDAFKQHPARERIFVNPSYGGREYPCKAVCQKKRCVKRGYHNAVYRPGLADWTALFIKWAEAGNEVVALMPSATDAEWWAAAAANAVETRLLMGRVGFINPDTGKPDGANTTGSTLFVFRFGLLRGDIWLWDWRKEL